MISWLNYRSNILPAVLQNSHVLLFCFQKKNILQNIAKTYTFVKASGGIFPCSFASTKTFNACSKFQLWASKHLKSKFYFFKNLSFYVQNNKGIRTVCSIPGSFQTFAPFQIECLSATKKNMIIKINENKNIPRTPRITLKKKSYFRFL